MRKIGILSQVSVKCYHRQSLSYNEWDWGYRENDILDGFDPYSNSKSCSELVTNCYKKSFFEGTDLAVSSARAGNVIGGGDFAKDRIMPDCVRAVMNGEVIIVRNPHSIRPFQHVLEPLSVYLMIVQAQVKNKELASSYNVGPNDSDCITTGKLVDLFCHCWGGDLVWENRADGGPHEARFLKLDCSKLKSVFHWHPRWNIDTAVQKTVEWTKAYLNGEEMGKFMSDQILEFMKDEDKTI